VKLTENQREERLAQLTLVTQARGGVCISSSYVDTKTKLRWRCALKHEWNAIPLNVARGHWCPICGNERQGRAKAHSIEMMRKIASSRGGECLSRSYKNNLTRLRWRCERGHEWNAVPGSVVGSGKRRGSWCPICAGKLPKDEALENLKHLALNRGGALLSTRYRDARTALRWKCGKGHVVPSLRRIFAAHAGNDARFRKHSRRPMPLGKIHQQQNSPLLEVRGWT